MKILKLLGFITIIVLVNIGVIIFSLSYKAHEDKKYKEKIDEKRKMEIQKFIDNILYIKHTDGKLVSYAAYAIDNDFYEKTGVYILVKVEELTNNKELLLKKKILPIMPEKKKEPIAPELIKAEQNEKDLTPKFPKEPEKTKSSKK